MGKEAILNIMENHSHCRVRTVNSDLISIVQEHGHYVAYMDRQFYCSGDTYQEVVQELSKDGIV